MHELIRESAANGLRSALVHYINDLEAMPEEALLTGAGGASRAPIDFTYEVSVVNARVAARLRGEDPGPWPFGEGWALAPDGFRSKPVIVEYLRSNTEAVVAAWEELPAERLFEKMPPPNETMSPLDMVSFCTLHLAHHDGQLNYIQALLGDPSVHW